MNIFAALMTDIGTGAISTIQILGDSTDIIRKIFKPAGTEPVKFQTSEILIGTIHDGEKTIDQVTIGCEQPGLIAIHCHGNPLIVEMIIQLLQRHGVQILTSEQFLIKILTTEKSTNTIEIEAKIALQKAKTLQGTKIISNQLKTGLAETSQNWLQKINDIPLKNIQNETNLILQNSSTAKLIIYGCTTALTGPPNTGKSTLLNYLAGREKAIVTDIKGTTRDWITAECQIESLSLELIDTAGLEENLSNSEDSIEIEAQKKSIEILEKSDLILLVLDNSRDENQISENFIEKIAGRKFITVLNKSDLPEKFNTATLSAILSNKIEISAKSGTGIEKLTEKIQQTCGVADFDMQTAVCFTDRQENLLRQLSTAKSKQQAESIITELLNGKI